MIWNKNFIMDKRESDSILPVNQSNFPAKLWQLVNDPEMEAIRWDSTGKGILIIQQDFEAMMRSNSKLDKSAYSFKTTNFSSFIRQLNLYGFKKDSRYHNELETQTDMQRKNVLNYYSPNFKKGHPELLIGLKRYTKINKAKLNAGMEVKCRPPNRHQRMLLNSTGKNAEEMGHVKWQHQICQNKYATPQDLQSPGSSQCDRTPLPSCACGRGPSGTSAMQPHQVHSPHRPMTSSAFYSPSYLPRFVPVRPSCPPGSLDPHTTGFQPSPVSYLMYGCYPDAAVQHSSK